MPLVQISLHQSPEGFARRVGDCVHRAMMESIKIPKQDHFQIITEHAKRDIVYDSSFLGIERTDGIMFIQITLASGRSRETKVALYESITNALSGIGVRSEDVFINLLEVSPENFSFGNGQAQFADQLPAHLRTPEDK